MSKKIKILTLSDHPLSPSGVGTQTRYVISLNGRRLFVTMLGSSQAFQANEKVYVNIPPEEIQILKE